MNIVLITIPMHVVDARKGNPVVRILLQKLHKHSWRRNVIKRKSNPVGNGTSSFASSNRILPFVYAFSGIFVELQKVIQSAGLFE